MSKWKIENGMVVEQPTIECPDWNNPRYSLEDFSHNHTLWGKEVIEYKRHIASLKKYHCSPELLAFYPEGSEVPEDEFQIEDTIAVLATRKSLREKVDEFFNSYAVEELIEDFKKLGYTFAPIKKESQEKLWEEALNDAEKWADKFINTDKHSLSLSWDENFLEYLRDHFTITRKTESNEK